MEGKETINHLAYDQDSGTLTITLQNFDGARLLALQKALLLGIEEIGICERSGDEDYQQALWNLTWLFRALMLNESQTNIALGGRAYKKSTKEIN